jgi:hypothetical protein
MAVWFKIIYNEEYQMNYKSNICSCIICHDIKSVKGIFSHYIIAHTTEGKKRILDSAEKSVSRTKEFHIKNANNKINSYNKNPKKCFKCSAALSYKYRRNKFCDRSCAAAFNNTQRDELTRQKQKDTLKETLKDFYNPKSKIEILSCGYCTKSYTWHHGKSKNYCSIECKKQGKYIKQSLQAKERGFGGVRQSKKINYKGILLGSTYELKLAKSLDENNIIWTKPKRISYIDPFGKERTYEADFYLPSYDVYLDPKNDFLIKKYKPKIRI